MKRIANYVLVVAALVMLPWALVHAQSSEPNSIDSIKVAQQGGVINLKLTFRSPLTAPPGFQRGQSGADCTRFREYNERSG